MTVETVLPSNTFCEDSQDSVLLSSDCMGMILNPGNHSLLKGYFFCWRFLCVRWPSLPSCWCNRAFITVYWKATSFGCFILSFMLLSLLCFVFLMVEFISTSEGWHHFIGEGLHELGQRVSQTILAWDVHELRYFSEGMSVVMKSHKLLLEYPNVCWLELLVRMNLTWTIYFQCLFMSNWKIPTFCYSKS